MSPRQDTEDLSRYRRIKKVINELKRSNIEQTAEEVSGILQEGEITDLKKDSSVFETLVDKTKDLYLENSFASLVKELYSSYTSEKDPSGKKDPSSKLFSIILMVFRQQDINTKRDAEECIAKLEIFLCLDSEPSFATRFLHGFISPWSWRSMNDHFMQVLIFLLEQGANPFIQINGTASFPSFLQFFVPNSNGASMSSAEYFLKEVSQIVSQTVVSQPYMLNDVVKATKDVIYQGINKFSSIKGLVLEICRKMIGINPAICDDVDSRERTPLHNLMEKLTNDDLWKRVPGFVAGTDILWNLMSELITEKNVNIKDINDVTLYSWVLWWQESVSFHDMPDKQKLTMKIQEIKNLWGKKGSNEKDAILGLAYLRIQNLTPSNIKQTTEDVLRILKKDGIIDLELKKRTKKINQ